MMKHYKKIIDACEGKWQQPNVRHAPPDAVKMRQVIRGRGFTTTEAVIDGVEYKLHYRRDLSGTVIVTRQQVTASVFERAGRHRAEGIALFMVPSIDGYYRDANEAYLALEIADSGISAAA